MRIRPTPSVLVADILFLAVVSHFSGVVFALDAKLMAVTSLLFVCYVGNELKYPPGI